MMMRTKVCEIFIIICKVTSNQKVKLTANEIKETSVNDSLTLSR